MAALDRTRLIGLLPFLSPRPNGSQTHREPDETPCRPRQGGRLIEDIVDQNGRAPERFSIAP